MQQSSDGDTRYLSQSFVVVRQPRTVQRLAGPALFRGVQDLLLAPGAHEPSR